MKEMRDCTKEKWNCWWEMRIWVMEIDILTKVKRNYWK